MRTFVVLCMLTAACDDASPTLETQVAELGTLEFEVPADWRRNDANQAGAATAVWTPAGENPRKESIMVIRGEPLGDRAKLENGRVEELLAGAQGALPNARVSPVVPIATNRNLHGARIDVTFTPTEDGRRYRRVHAVLVDAQPTAMVHVIYTAASPDTELLAFYTLLESLHEEG